MMTLGLTATERSAYEKALRSSHVRHIDVDVLTLDGDVLSKISPVFLGGQVDVDSDGEVTRSASVQFLDPRHALNFDTDSPDDGALYADRMIRIRYGVEVEALARTVWATVFVGPVTKLQRDGEVVSVEAQGKEALVRGAIWRPLTLKKGARVTAAIKTLVGDRGGETEFSFPEIRTALPKARSLARTAEIWATAKSLARGLNRQLFYNGAGTLVLRSLPGSVVYTFRTGDGGDVLAGLSVSYELADVKNVVEVKGQPPRGKSGRVRGVAIAPASHPLSPFRLGRKNAPRYLVQSVEDSSIRSDAAANARAQSILDDLLREVVDVSFDSLPIPHLDPGDLVRVKTDELDVTFRIRKFSIPLSPTGSPTMPVGYLKKTSPNRKRIRR
jgi:hypothetical protein